MNSPDKAPVKIEKHIQVESSEADAVTLLADASGLSKQAIKKVMASGAVWHTRGKQTHRIRRAKKALVAGDELHLYYDEAILAQQPAQAELIADETSFSIWFKPRGMFSQGSKWGDHCSIDRHVETRMQRPAFIVHRLDRHASGLMIIAHSKKIAAAFAKLFRERKIDKRYEAIVSGRFPEMLTMDTPVDYKAAVSHVRLLNYDSESDRSLLEINIETGRKHQIRQHLAEAGFPIIGDRLYGKADEKEGDLQLLSSALAFASPADGEFKNYRIAPGAGLLQQHHTP
ncbi:RluA family pseudouridine synthase [Solemya velum gill symbiont]|uniref:RluA family pseudouridine synthase n=1 Tax=Solemya velum gill symbiont TaxID=2340 RepID=UPI0009976A05|nr:RluA family pseudouridine synthase [Solemya velum gill symbiont]OOZ46084.1 RNA pseudouridine synthase [Solemya velum gill symbiont]OOZ47604.1 RNA pseudouridine synthase [Solemya velum gill symbiont]OOZ50145.1 RNA pseudouridine synthase [Solemya velum gill symbiont]OOZ52619.1 RNA pseudouridine synthase [Solemya velum gill symbiont]OOZ55728.1 RNA pseudouridine synthase [Solemya velum gill symbiont]